MLRTLYSAKYIAVSASAGVVRYGVAQFYVGRNNMNRNRHPEPAAEVQSI